MSIKTIGIAALAAAGAFLAAPSAALANTSPQIVTAFAYEDGATAPSLYTEARYHSRRAFHRGAHRFHRGYYGRHGFKHRNYHRYGVYDHRFRHHGVHGTRQFRNKHGVIIKKRH